MIGVRLIAVGLSAENHQGSEPEQNPKQRARNGEPKGNIPVSGATCLHAIFSSVRRPTFQKIYGLLPLAFNRMADPS
jgi:hypothetical protein